MIIQIAHDGDIFNPEQMKRFRLNEKMDVVPVHRFDNLSGSETDAFDYRLNFVGFVTDEQDNLLAVFPKNFEVENPSSDGRLVFDVITTYFQRRHTDFIGELAGEKWETSFPFAAFFSIYSYYRKNGLFFETKEILETHPGGKISWKETIRKSQKLICDGKLIIHPFLYKKTRNVSSFLTQCMVFAIDHTFEKFGELLNISRINFEVPSFDLVEHKEAIVNELARIRRTTFKDDLLNLIDSLITFFQKINYGGCYYLKHYSFSSIWEEAVRRYLSRHFAGIKNDIIQLTPKPKKPVLIEKKTFNPNEAASDEYFQPDFYLESSDCQYIFDAKYYLNPHGLMYKELAYVLLLKDVRDFVDGKAKFLNTSCAVILPSNQRKTLINFKMNPLFSNYHADVKIMEEYFDIKEVLNDYLDESSWL